MMKNNRNINRLISKLYEIGRQIRKVTLLKTLNSEEADLIWHKKSFGDEEFLIDMKPAEILKYGLDQYGRKNNLRIEIVGEGLDDCIIGQGELKYIVHVDVLDGTRETLHKVGLSFFEAGVLPWKEDPRLSDTLAGLAVAIGFDPLDGKLYSYFSSFPLSNFPLRSYRRSDEGEGGGLVPTQEKDFNNKGFFNTITSFRGTGVLTVLKDRMLQEIYGSPGNPDIFHREILTSCGELLNVAKGGTRGCMDLRPAVALIAEQLNIKGYPQSPPLSMHPYDVSGVYPIIRNTRQAVIQFYDHNLNVLKPEDILIRNVDLNIGFIACGNEVLMKKITDALRAVLG